MYAWASLDPSLIIIGELNLGVWLHLGLVLVEAQLSGLTGRCAKQELMAL